MGAVALRCRHPKSASLASGQRQSQSGRARLLLLVLAVLIAAGGALGLGLWRFATSPMRVADKPVRIVVQPGSGLRTISRTLADQQIIVSPWAFGVVARARGQGDRLRAGVYEVNPGMTPLQLLDRMARGESLQDRITLIEGWTFTQMRSALDAHPGLRHDTAGMQVGEILERLGVIERNPEGLFFPDTYNFALGTSDLQILRAANSRLRRQLEAAWAERSANLPLASPYEALILASIVERETGRPEDRLQIAAVFLNRLRTGMRLQSDPTVIYGLGDAFDGNLKRIHLETDSPYNTYVRGGLPPTPIAMVGADSIRAVTRPPPSRALYFVARGDGSSEFSSNLDDHNRAVARFQKR